MVSERSSPSKGWEEIHEELVQSPKTTEEQQDTDIEPGKLELKAREELPKELATKLVEFSNYIQEFRDYTEERIEEKEYDSSQAKAGFCNALESYYDKKDVFGVFQDTGDSLKPIFIAVEDEDSERGVSWRDQEYFPNVEYEGDFSKLDPLTAFVENIDIHEAFNEHYVAAWRMSDYVQEGLEMDSLGFDSPHEPGIYAPMNEEVYTSTQDL